MDIRDARPGDEHAICAIYAPYVNDGATSFELEVPTAAEMSKRISQAQSGWAWVVAVDDDQIIGYAYATELRSRPAYRYSCETSVYISPKAQGRGIAKALYQALFDRLVHGGLCNAYAVIVLPNSPSVRLHEAMGFQPAGILPRAGFKHGAWHSIGWWYRPLQDWPDPLHASTSDASRRD